MGAAETRARRTDAELLRSVPVVCDHVSCVVHAGGCTLLRRLPARGRFEAFLSRFGFDNKRAFELDRIGADFFRAIDGERELADIERSLRERHGFSEADSRRAVIAYTEQLMARGLVAVTPAPVRGAR